MDNNEVKKAIDQLHVPDEAVLKAIQQGINRNEQTKNASSTRKWLISGVAAATIIGGTFTSGFISPHMNKVLAQAPLVGDLYKKFGDDMGANLADQHLVTSLNETSTKNGVEVTLTSAYFDGDVVSVTGHVNDAVDNGMNEKGEVSFDMNFENEKGDSDIWKNGGMTKKINKVNGGYDFQLIITYPYDEFNTNLTLPITIRDINGIKGDWNFDVPLTQRENETIVVNHTENYPKDQTSFTVEKINKANASSTLTYKVFSPYKRDQIDFKKAVDDKGNVLYTFSNTNVLTERKVEGGYIKTIRKPFEKLPKDIKSITLYPAVMDIREEPVTHSLNASTFTLKSKRSDLGVHVQDVKQNGNKVVITYVLENFPKRSRSQQEILKKNLEYELWLVDKAFVNEIDPKNPGPPKHHSISKSNVTTLNEKTNQFQSTFYLDGDEKIENFSLNKTSLYFDFSVYIEGKEFKPFTIKLPN